jgi:hypothetical protein
VNFALSVSLSAGICKCVYSKHIYTYVKHTQLLRHNVYEDFSQVIDKVISTFFLVHGEVLKPYSI